MTKFTQLKKTRTTYSQQSKTSPRIASSKPSKTPIVRKTADRPKAAALPSGKIAAIVTHLHRPKGASIADLMKVTGWQAHSVRGAISASIKKKLRLNVVSEKTDKVRLYRIADKSAG